MLRPVQITPPATQPVSVDLLKQHARILFDEDDQLLDGYLDAAVSHLDGYSGVLGRCLINQSWRQDFEHWSCQFRLPFPDVSEASVSYRSGASLDIAPADYEVLEDATGSFLRFGPAFTGPRHDDVGRPISVTFTAGYGAENDVPWKLRVAIMRLATHWYDNPADSLPRDFTASIAQFRRFRL